jgi:hypothetical protein
MNIPNPFNVTLLEIVSDYTGLYREVKFTGDIVHNTWFGLKRTIKPHSYVAFGNVGNWLIVNIDGQTRSVPVHANSIVRSFLDSTVLFVEYKKNFKVATSAMIS